jgi:lysozyme
MNDQGFLILTNFEGCEEKLPDGTLRAYQDEGGVWTIGFGCTHHVTPGLIITMDDAKARLAEDLQEFVGLLDHYLGPCKPNINANQYSAMLSLLYNIGTLDFATSTLLNCVRMRHFDDAAKEFPRWCKEKGVRDKGLFRRRMAEQSLFNGDIESMEKYINDIHSVDVLFAP